MSVVHPCNVTSQAITLQTFSRRDLSATWHTLSPRLTTGALSTPRTWLERWLRPSCWMALSALQGSSQVKWTRRARLSASALACREMPVLAASDTMATSLSPFMKAAAQQAIKSATPLTCLQPLRPERPPLKSVSSLAYGVVVLKTVLGMLASSLSRSVDALEHAQHCV